MKEEAKMPSDFTHIFAMSQDRPNVHNIESGKSYQKNGLAEDLLVDKNRMSRELFFICKNCDGPLIQYTFCRICKKTTSRICTKCDLVKTVGDHNQCFRVMLLDLEGVSQKKDFQTSSSK